MQRGQEDAGHAHGEDELLREWSGPTVELAREFIALGFTLCSTGGTAKLLRENGIEVQSVNKLMEGRPHGIDMINGLRQQNPLQIVDWAQAVENDYIGSPCGQLDQIMIYFARAGMGRSRRPGRS